MNVNPSSVSISFMTWRGNGMLLHKSLCSKSLQGRKACAFLPLHAVFSCRPTAACFFYSSCLQLLFQLLFQQKGPLLINFFHSLRAFCEQNADFAIRYGNWKIAESTTKRLFSSPISVKNSSKQLRNKHFFRLAKTFPKPPDFVTFLIRTCKCLIINDCSCRIRWRAKYG